MPSGKPRTSYFEIDDDEEPGFFGLLNDVWGEADDRRDALIEERGEALGRWHADIGQYGAAWSGDAYQAEARRAENHPAFRTMDDWDYWDHAPTGVLLVSFHFRISNGEDHSTQTSRAATFSIAGGKIIG